MNTIISKTTVTYIKVLELLSASDGCVIDGCDLSVLPWRRHLLPKVRLRVELPPLGLRHHVFSWTPAEIARRVQGCLRVVLVLACHLVACEGKLFAAGDHEWVQR